MVRFTALSAFLVCGLCPLLSQAELKPSEATTLMVRAMQRNPTAERTSITRPIIARMKTVNDDEIEWFFEGEAHFINFDPEPARDAFWALRDRNDDVGRVAWQRLMIIRINAFDMVDELVDHDIPMYRERFGVSAHDRYGISYPLMQTAIRMAERGQAGRALDLIADEVGRHDRFDAPYYAYRLPAAFMDLAREHDRAPEFQELQRWVRDGIDRALRQRLTQSPPPQRGTYTLPGTTFGTLFDDQLLDYHGWTAEFLRLKAQLAASRPQ